VIGSSRNVLFTRDRTLKIKDGLLTSVSTNDAGKVGGVLTTLLYAVLNGVASHPAGVDFEGATTPGDDPTAEELIELYSSILAGKHTIAFTEGNFFTGLKISAVPKPPRSRFRAHWKVLTKQKKKQRILDRQ
jgi:hypothetical protein